MYFRIDLSNGQAIYEQIAWQLKFAVAKGVLRGGELVPSVRELSRQITVNPNTVARAYRELQTDGVLEPVRGTGMRVTPAAVEQCQRERDQLLHDRLARALCDAHQAGVTTSAIKNQIDTLLQTLNSESEGDTP